MLWNIGLTLALATAVGGAVLALDKPIALHPNGSRIVGLAMIAGGLLVVATDLNGAWWQLMLGVALAVVGGSTVGTARRARRGA